MIVKEDLEAPLHLVLTGTTALDRLRAVITTARRSGEHVVVFADVAGLPAGCQVVDRAPAAQLDMLQDLHLELHARRARRARGPRVLVVITDDEPLTGCVREPIVDDLAVRGPQCGIRLALLADTAQSRRLVAAHQGRFTTPGSM